MKKCALTFISMAVAYAVLFCPRIGRTQTPDAETANNTADSAAAQQQAAQMVPAEAVLDKELDAKKAQQGEQFSAKLTSTVHLKNGTELPKGTALVGKITTDNMGHAGESSLALQFTEAQLKDGKTIPIQATIVGISAPASSESWDYSAGGAPPDEWNGQALQVDDQGVLSGVDLHSRIGGENSGVFVSKRSDMKLAARSQISLAIYTQSAAGVGGE
jgi:hypothetical protein